MTNDAKAAVPSPESLLEKIFENAPEYFVVLDPDLSVRVAGATFRRATGVEGRNTFPFLETVEQFSLSKVRSVFEELRGGSIGSRTLEINHRTGSGDTRTVAYSWVSCLDEGGTCRAFVGIGREVTEDGVEGSEEMEPLRQEIETLRMQLERRAKEISRLREEIKVQATRDEMTDLGNRRFLMERLEFESARAARYDEPLTLILFDVDRMTHVNEVHGQDKGDEVIREVAAVVREQIRTTDVAGRFDGEEFLILCPNTDRTNAQFLAERLRRRVSELSFTGEEDSEFGVTISVGLVTVGPDNEFEVEAIVQAAEQALEAAKTSGMNRVRVLEVI